MKKAIIILALAVMTFSGMAQIGGNYAASQFAADPDTIFNSRQYIIEVGGLNYSWQLSSTWADSSVLTTSTVFMQISPDGVKWMNYGTPDSLKSETYSFKQADYFPSRYIRYNLQVTSGDTIYGFKAWYEFKKR